MLYVSDNGQAKPAIYEIQKEDSRYFIVEAFKRLYISYDAVKDSISISYYGEYLRNWQMRMSIIQTNYKSIERYNNMELINSNSEIIKDFFQSMERMLDGISRLAKENKPHLNGEKFLSNRDAAKCLKVSIRTLQEWRDTGVIPYIQIKGKIIYRQSDIERLLQTYYNKEQQE